MAKRWLQKSEISLHEHNGGIKGFPYKEARRELQIQDVHDKCDVGDAA